MTGEAHNTGRVAVVIPTYNEAANLDELLRRVRAVSDWVEIVVVDDASPDGSADVVRRVGAELGGIHLVERRPPRSYSASCQDGFRFCLDAGFPVIAVMDADLSHLPEQLPQLLDAVHAGADLAIGSRYVAGGSIPRWGLHRRLLSNWGNTYAVRLLRLPVHDATSGFRAYRAEVLRSYAPGEKGLHGYAFLIDALVHVVGLGATVVEVPIVFVEREHGKSKMSLGIAFETLRYVTARGAQRIRTRRR